MPKCESFLFPKHVEMIEKYTFAGWRSLRYVAFERSCQLTTFGDFSFAECSLTQISIPPYIVRLCRGCFLRSRSLFNIFFDPRSLLTEICAEAFFGCPAPHLIIPSNVSRIDGSSLLDLASITVSRGNRSFSADGTFLIHTETQQLIRYLLPDSEPTISPNIREIGSFSFAFCQIHKVHFSGNAVLRIASSAFHSSGLRHLTLPPSITTLEDRCFSRCKSFVDITFSPDSSLREIGELAFAGSGLQRIAVPRAVVVIGPQAFADCRCLAVLSFDPKSALHAIEESAFARTLIEKVCFPASLTHLGNGAFCGCEVLSVVASPKGCLLTEFPEKGFAGSSIRRITIPKSIVSIGPYCFRRCDVLKEVIFEEGSRLRYIQGYAFASCGLVKVNLPALVEFIDESAFMHQKDLRTVVFGIGTTLKGFAEWAFCDSGLRSIVIPKSVEKIGKFCFHVCQDLIAVTFENDGRLKVIDDHAFSYTDLREISIPRTVEYIGKRAFDSCKLLAVVEFETGSVLARIAEGAFLECCMNQIKIPSITYLDKGKIFPQGCILVQEWRPTITATVERPKQTPTVTTPIVAPTIVPGPSLSPRVRIGSGRDQGKTLKVAASADGAPITQRKVVPPRANLAATTTRSVTTPSLRGRKLST
jgi:hypothetical protein